MEMGGIFFKNLELYPPSTIRFGRVIRLLTTKLHQGLVLLESDKPNSSSLSIT